MNKTELVKKVSEKSGLTQAEGKKALEATLETIKEALAAGEAVSLIGFGTVSVAERPARQGINPRTKEPIEIPAKQVAKFKAGAGLI